MNGDLLQRPAPTVRSVDESLLFRLYDRTIVPWAARQLPAWLAPNVITVMGQGSAILGLMAAAAAVAGRPVFYLASALLFMAYLFCDILDGMQARRTGRITKTGELLDHGLDTVSALCALLTVGIVLRVDGGVLVALAYGGMLASVAAYWELYRTGLLSAIGRSESFTGLAVLQVALFLFHEPAWLRFSFRSPTIGTMVIAVVLLGAPVALVETARRVRKSGIPPGQLVLFAITSLAPVGYLLAGAKAWMVGVLIGLFAADVVVRSLRLRRRGQLGQLVVWPHATAMLPLALAMLPDPPLNATALAALGAAVLAGFYARSLIGGLREGVRFGR